MQTAAVGAAASLVTGGSAWARPLRRADGMVLRPYPSPLQPEFTWAYATTPDGDPFESPLTVTREGIVLPDSMGGRPFSVNARWYVEGFGFVWLEADNAGRFYTTEAFREASARNLNIEFARSYTARNAATLARFAAAGTRFSAEVQGLHALSQEVLEAAEKHDGEQAGQRANQSLLYALWAGEKIEMEHATSVLARPRTGEFHFGCETRQYIWARSEMMTERFEDVFDFATVTHYIWDSWYPLFEPREGVYRWGLKDDIVDWLVERGITVEGRPLLWFHPTVTPDWLREKSLPDLKRYVENHVRELVGHYGDKVLHWEVVNEYHDWANVHDLTPDQITEVTRLACETTHEVNTKVDRLINNCCPYGLYAAYREAAHGTSNRPLRTPRQFVSDIVEAGVPFETVGVQMYFPERSLADIIRHVERFAAFGKPVYITEIGASSGPTKGDILAGKMDLQGPLYDWHRPWDEDVQADWLEQLYTVFYSKPYIKAVNWYDFADFRTFIPNGGLIREDATPKESYRRLETLLDQWGRLPPARRPRKNS